MDEWTLVYEGFEPDEEGLREALCTLGNGVLATRGAAPEASADGVHYPGTYLAGVFNRLFDEVDGQVISNESLVNLPNWLTLRFRAGNGRWFSMAADTVEDHRLELDLRRGVLTRHLTAIHDDGRRTLLTQRRFVHMADPQLAALETTFVALDWEGTLTVRSTIDGAVRNRGVARYHELSDQHLDVVGTRHVDDETVTLTVESTTSRLRIAEATRTRVRDGTRVGCRRVDAPTEVGQEVELALAPGQQATVEKVAAVVSIRDHAIAEPTEHALRKVARAPAFDQLLSGHVAKWEQLWDRFEIRFGGHEPIERILNVHTFHTLQTVSHNTIDRDVGVPARGLHGEAYRGHIFWDELFVLPYLNLRLPVLSRSLLMYRYRRLPEARIRAQQAGHAGALYPWQSGSDGREESQELHLNPRSGRWEPDNSWLQRHINAAVAYNVWQYVETTDDREFLRYRGAEMLVEIARGFASLATYDRAEDRYHIREVMGPDEFHDAYPDRDQPGLDDNAYTNVMVVWTLLRVLDLLELFPDHVRHDVWTELHLRREELEHWEDMTRRMAVPFHGDGIISQFAGYDELEEFDWEGYRERYDDIHRLDRILHAEGDTPNRYKVSKQADVLMLFYLLSPDQLERILRRLGYDWSREQIPATIEHYQRRTSHGSTLSGLVHAWVSARSDRERSWELFRTALQSDIADLQGGTTPEGIHLGAMAGTLDLVQRCYTGLSVEGDLLCFDPALPDEVERLDLTLHYRGHGLSVGLDHAEIRIAAPASDLPAVTIGVGEERCTLAGGQSLAVPVPAAT